MSPKPQGGNDPAEDTWVKSGSNCACFSWQSFKLKESEKGLVTCLCRWSPLCLSQVTLCNHGVTVGVSESVERTEKVWRIIDRGHMRQGGISETSSCLDGTQGSVDPPSAWKPWFFIYSSVLKYHPREVEGSVPPKTKRKLPRAASSAGEYSNILFMF